MDYKTYIKQILSLKEKRNVHADKARKYTSKGNFALATVHFQLVSFYNRLIQMKQKAHPKHAKQDYILSHGLGD